MIDRTTNRDNSSAKPYRKVSTIANGDLYRFSIDLSCLDRMDESTIQQLVYEFGLHVNGDQCDLKQLNIEDITFIISKETFN